MNQTSGSLRSKIKEDHPDLNHADIEYVLARMWSDLPDERRSFYEKSAIEEKNKQQQNANQLSHNQVQDMHASHLSRKKEWVAYMVFCTEYRECLIEEIINMGLDHGVVEMQEALYGMWSSLSDEERRPYIDRAESNLTAFDLPKVQLER